MSTHPVENRPNGKTSPVTAMAETQAAQTGLHRDPGDEAFLAPLLARARAALGAQGFPAAESAGRELPFEQAIAEARAWLFGARPAIR